VRRPEEKAALYGFAKSAPVKRYAEESTFLHAVGDLRGRAVLDLACGSGHYTRALKRRGAGRVVGVDISHDMIAAARTEEAKHPLGIEYVVGDATQIGRLGSFGIVAAAYLFVYADRVEALSAMCRTVAQNLHRDGRLVAVTIHPRLSLAAQMPFERSGASIESLDGEELRDGAAILVRIGDDQGTYEVRDYFWSEQTYASCLRAAGLSRVEWHELRPSDEGRRAMGEQFWREFLKNPAVVVLTAALAPQK
jgi:SAM-dependent methyltransferase